MNTQDISAQAPFNLTPEQITTIIYGVCGPESTDSIIVTLKNVEESIQHIAYEERDGSLDYLFRYSMDLRKIREQFEKLEDTLGYDNKQFRD